MSKKKMEIKNKSKNQSILVLGPITAAPQEINRIAASLSFLQKHHILTFWDPLSVVDEAVNQDFYSIWKKSISEVLNSYTVYVGFSFGGVILQHCFPLLERENKKVILFSTPSFAGVSLRRKLEKVIHLCESDQVSTALQQLYQNVYLNQIIKEKDFEYLDQQSARKRLVFGLKRILQTDSRSLLAKCDLPYLHLIGADSQLVTEDDVLEDHNVKLVRVPNSGMRVLQDNPEFCHKKIIEYLSQ